MRTYAGQRARRYAKLLRRCLRHRLVWRLGKPYSRSHNQERGRYRSEFSKLAHEQKSTGESALPFPVNIEFCFRNSGTAQKLATLPACGLQTHPCELPFSRACLFSIVVKLSV